jgi:hypothetical protein
VEMLLEYEWIYILCKESKVKRKTGTKTVDIVTIFCDWCECRLDFDSGHDHSLTTGFNYGYYSKRDGYSAEYHFCSECAEKIEKYLTTKMPGKTYAPKKMIVKSKKK